MMKNFMLILPMVMFCLITKNLSAQSTGVQTRTPKSSALLDMDVSNLADGAKKGFLMSRVSLTRTNLAAPVNLPVSGLWVFNTNTTTGLNAVKGNNVYMWNGSAWEPYSSTLEIQTRISPDDFFMKSPTDFLMSGVALTGFNTGLLVPVPWEAGSVAISNPTYVTLDANLESFTINTSGYYEISGFLNYNPKINDNNSKTALCSILQINKLGVWTDRIGINSTFEEMATNTVQTITIPFDIIKLDAGDKFRIVITKPIIGGNVNHTSTAGITSIVGDLRKSFRITYINQ
ncbi:MULTISPECIES: hypothetical protein [unclassified Pedobacter]|uniref:hypothetical protein n=1 Tax=unclassified Pedobacter TaxID=2628915 RepID=UPI001E3792ED|nr:MULTISPECIES: hypothetical protein [unclassified Pedobacter]